MVSSNLDKVIGKAKEVFLLDFSWHLHRNFNTFKWMSVDMSGYQRPTGHIYGVLYTIQSIKRSYPNSVIILCKDGIPVERQEIYQGQDTHYKEGRSELEFDFYKDSTIIEALAYMVPDVYLAYHPQKESDDIMYALSKQIEQISDAKVFIYSGDDDLLQAVSDRTVVVRRCENGVFEEIDNFYITSNERMLKKYHGVDSYHLPYYRIIVGDKSDRLSGIPRFPRELARDIALFSSSFEDIFNYCPITQTERKYLDLLRENRSLLELNWRMMKLSSDIEVPLYRKKAKPEYIKNYIETYKLSRFYQFLKSIRECESNV